MKKALIALAALAGVTVSPLALAQSAFPNKSIRWVVPYPAGGGSDFMARTVAAQMGADLGQTILVDGGLNLRWTHLGGDNTSLFLKDETFRAAIRRHE